MQTTRELRVQPELSRRMGINPVTCDLHRQHGGIRGWSQPSQRRGRAETCCCNSSAPQVPRICFDFFFFLVFLLFCVIQSSKSRSDSNPDRRKTPRLHVRLSVVPTFINDRQTTARQASIIWYYVPLCVSAQVCRKQIPSFCLFIYFLPKFLQLAPDKPAGLSVFIIFFLFWKEEYVVSIWLRVFFFSFLF